MTNTILLVGCGNMGYAMLKGWIAADSALAAHVVEPAEPLRERARGAGARAVAGASDLPADLAPDLIFLAVKPQVMAEVVPAYARFAGGPRPLRLDRRRHDDRDARRACCPARRRSSAACRTRRPRSAPA